MYAAIALLALLDPWPVDGCGTFATGSPYDVVDVVAVCGDAPSLPACVYAAAELYGHTRATGRRAWWISQNCPDGAATSKACGDAYAIFDQIVVPSFCAYPEGDLDACAAAADPDGDLDESTVAWLCALLG